jgi:hypothetical protein
LIILLGNYFESVSRCVLEIISNQQKKFAAVETLSDEEENQKDIGIYKCLTATDNI